MNAIKLPAIGSATYIRDVAVVQFEKPASRIAETMNVILSHVVMQMTMRSQPPSIPHIKTGGASFKLDADLLVTASIIITCNESVVAG